MRTAVLASFVAILCVPLYAQTSTPNVTIKSNPRLVAVDVVVTGADGQPVMGLTASDFTVYEDGKPQSVRSFDAYQSSDSIPKPASIAPAVRPNEYSNIPRSYTPGAMNVVLLDILNTQVSDQDQVRRHMLAFLKDMPPGQNLAVFTLTSHQIRMLQGVTTDSSKLIAVVDKLLAMKGILLSTDEDRTQDLAIINEIATISPNAAQGLADFLGTVEQRHVEDRIQITTQALQAIARVLAGYPGRKNLVWISGGFPISFEPGSQFGGQYAGGINAHVIENYAPRLRETASLLAASHIAIYPVDARGLTPFMVSAGLPSREGRTITDTRAAANSDVLGAMDELAEVTGGKAFYNSNDLHVGITRAVTLGSTYYALTYTPSNPKWDGSFRKIKVTVARPKVQVLHRRGYYATPDNSKPEAKQLKSDMIAAMLPVSAESTALLFKATVLPPDADGKMTVTYTVGPGQITAHDAANRTRDLELEFVVAAWDTKGNSTGQLSQTLRVPGASEAASQIEQTGFTKSEKVVVMPGTTQLRIGLVDHNTGKIGTIDVPLRPALAAQGG